MSEKEKIRAYIEQNINIFDEVEFANDDNIFEKGFVNSLFAMKLLAFIEKEFDVEIDDEDIQIKNFSSVDNMMKLVEKKKYENA